MTFPSEDVVVYLRDGFKCQICGWTPGLWSTAGLEIDHKIPLSRGGSDTILNKQVLCALHNREKGTMTDTEYRRQILLKQPILGRIFRGGK